MSFEIKQQGTITLYKNNNGVEIATSSIPVIEQEGYIFKDLARNATLIPCADWRLTAEERAKDLVDRLALEDMIALMIHTSNQNVPALPRTMFSPGTYNGAPYDAEVNQTWDLTDQQKDLIAQGVRHFLVSRHDSVEAAVKWTNNLQERAEGLPFAIPVNLSSDPRHRAAGAEVEFNSSAKGVSRWPEGLGTAAITDEKLWKKEAEVISKEYRALGITTFLGPQIDLATDPRWFRIPDTLGSEVDWVTKITKAYCDGLQTTEGTADGWGSDSVIAMAKHWPGGGTGEGGRDAHYPFGKYAVYPGNNFETHLRPFVEGAMQLEDGTKACGAIMPYYTISWDQDIKNQENVGNAYSEYIIKDLLLGRYKYDGVVCTDWNIVQDQTPHIGMYVRGGKCHGVEALTIPERYSKMIANGVNQFGGVDNVEDATAGYELGCSVYGEDYMLDQVKISAYKILRNLFRLGLFENPYLDLETSSAVIGCKEHRAAGEEAQVASVVVLKDKEETLSSLRVERKQKVYIPNRHIKSHYGFVRFPEGEKVINPVEDSVIAPYFDRVENPDEADLAIVFVESPVGNGGFEPEDTKVGENGYRPISLQYRPYTATLARKESIAGGDPREEGANRSYYGKTETTANERDLDNVIETKKCMGDKPVIVIMRMNTPTVMAEMEPYADCMLVEFGVEKQVLFKILVGEHMAKGRLPFPLPNSMETVELHKEDCIEDIEVYMDTLGNKYEAGFGL